MYWPFNTPKEIEFLPWQERENLCSLAKWYHLRNPHTRVRMMIEAVAVLVGWALPGILSGPLGCPLWLRVSWGIAAPFLLLAMCAAVERWHFRRVCAVESLIRGIRPSGCFNCGYNLTGTVSDHCPECGVALATHGQSRQNHLKHQMEEIPRKVKWGLICAVIGVVLCFTGLRLYDAFVADSYRAISKQREAEMAAAVPMDSPLAAARTWLSGRGLRQGCGPGPYGMELMAIEALSSGDLLHRPSALILYFHVDRDDRVTEIRCSLADICQAVPLPASAKWREPLRKVIPLTPLAAFALWAFWCLRRDIRKNSLRDASTPPRQSREQSTS